MNNKTKKITAVKVGQHFIDDVGLSKPKTASEMFDRYLCEWELPNGEMLKLFFSASGRYILTYRDDNKAFLRQRGNVSRQLTSEQRQIVDRFTNLCGGSLARRDSVLVPLTRFFEEEGQLVYVTFYNNHIEIKKNGHKLMTLRNCNIRMIAEYIK